MIMFCRFFVNVIIVVISYINNDTNDAVIINITDLYIV